MLYFFVEIVSVIKFVRFMYFMTELRENNEWFAGVCNFYQKMSVRVCLMNGGLVMDLAEALKIVSSQ